MAASVNSLAHTFGSRPYNSYIEGAHLSHEFPGSGPD